MSKDKQSSRLVLRWLRRGVYLIGALGLAAAITIAWLPKPVAVESAVAARGHMRVTVDEDGQTRIKDRYVLSAPLFGTLARIELDPGDGVKQGQVVAWIAANTPALLDVRARATAQARLAQTRAAEQQSHVQIDRAETGFEFAAQELKRQQQLVERGAGVKQQLEQAELAARRAEKELKSQKFAARIADFEVKMARAALEQLSGGRGPDVQFQVPAPVSGQVLKVMHKSEGVVQPGASILELGDPAELEVVVDVLTSDATRIHPSAMVLLERWGGPSVEGRVRRVEPSAFTRLSALGVEEQRINVLIDIVAPREKWEALGDGYRVEARIVVFEGEGVLKVPASAVFRQGSGWALFRIVGGRARLAKVELGQRTTSEVEVRAGLSADERVVVHPSDRVMDGVRVATQ